MLHATHEAKALGCLRRLSLLLLLVRAARALLLLERRPDLVLPLLLLLLGRCDGVSMHPLRHAARRRRRAHMCTCAFAPPSAFAPTCITSA